jgi:hypothetical protein
MCLLVFILVAATVGALSAPRTEVLPIESLRFNTRSPSGWLLLVALIVLPLEIFLLIVRFLNFTWVIEHIKIALGIVSDATYVYVYVLGLSEQELGWFNTPEVYGICCGRQAC